MSNTKMNRGEILVVYSIITESGCSYRNKAQMSDGTLLARNLDSHKSNVTIYTKSV